MFSIIMPYYKNRNIISRGVESVRNQTESDFELIIVDDGSFDDIEEYLISLNDNRIKLIKQRNMGVAAARNNGIKISKGEWVCFLDSDDEWMPYHLEEINNMQQKFPYNDFYLTSHIREGNTIEYSNAKIPDYYEDIFVVEDMIGLINRIGNVVHTNSVCIRKGLILRCGGFVQNINKGEDTDLWYRCMLLSGVVVSKRTTTIYHRDFSFLTKDKDFNFQWVFLDRENQIASSTQISDIKKESAKYLIQKYRLSACKRYLAKGKKEECKKILVQLRKKICGKLRLSYIKIYALYLIPKFILVPILSVFYETKRKNY